ncbi:unnamed protein product [Prunus brigantina]
MKCPDDVKIQQAEIQKDCIYDFLVGLDDEFDKIRGYLLRMFIPKRPLGVVLRDKGFIMWMTLHQVMFIRFRGICVASTVSLWVLYLNKIVTGVTIPPVAAFMLP